jgi:parallel beta-helix repeat protein
VGNTTYNNALFNPYHMSGIAIYEPRAVSFTPTSADTGALYHIIVKSNVSHDNSERYASSAHSDGNGIILDDFRNAQASGTPYPYRSLVQGNTVYANGGSGVHVYETDGATIDSNMAFNNNKDVAMSAFWRGELYNSVSSNNIWTNNQAAATSVAAPSNGSTDWRAFNRAVFDGHVGAANVNVIWSNNANIDTRTGGKSYLIDDPARAAAFPKNNPLGKALSPAS